MEGDLVRRDFYDPPVPVGRQTRKQLARIQQDAAINHAMIVAQEKNSLRQLEAREREAYLRAQQRLNGGFDLATHTVHRATHLNHSVTQAAQGNPGLELTLRGVEDTAALAAKIVIYEYMTGR